MRRSSTDESLCLVTGLLVSGGTPSHSCVKCTTLNKSTRTLVKCRTPPRTNCEKCHILFYCTRSCSTSL